MVLCVAVAIRYSERGDFTLTPTDFLVVIVVSSLAILSSSSVIGSGITAITLKAVILFYGCELTLNWMARRWNVFTVSVLLSLVVVCIRGLGLVKA
jgi:hypothetical protein